MCSVEGVGAPATCGRLYHKLTHPRKLPVWVGFFFARTALLDRPARARCTACGRPCLPLILSVGIPLREKEARQQSCGHLFGSSILPPGARRLVADPGEIDPLRPLSRGNALP